MRKLIFYILTLLFLTALACNFNFSTANIAEATMAKDPEGEQPTTVFAQDDTFYLVTDVAYAPDDTRVKTVWIAVEADGVEPDFMLGEKELTGGGSVNFSLENDQLWPVGDYKAELYLNDELARTLEFTVEGEAVTQEPTPTLTPTLEPTATPTLEPTEPAAISSGDSLTLKPTNTPTPEPAEEAESLAFQPEPYVHPSGAFSIAVPEAWQKVDEDELSAAFGDELSRVGVIFVDTEAVLDEDGMKEFINSTLGIIADTFSENYEVVAEDNALEEDGFYYLAISFDDGDGDAEFFYEPWDTVVYILYFASLQYEEMSPTWTEIINNYQVDPDAALAAASETEPTPAPPPTAPPPPPGPSAPAGKGLLVFINNTGVDFVVDVIGPTNTSEVVPPNSSKEFVLDPGSYTINGHSPGGEWAIDAYQFDLAAGQVFPLNLN